MFKFQEPAILRFRFTEAFWIAKIYNISDPYFKVGDDWFFPSRQVGRLVHETKMIYLEESYPRPTHYRDGLEGVEVEIPFSAFCADVSMVSR